jgi:hypothetical protein
VITEEDPEINGPADAAVLAPLRASAPVFAKTVFGLADCPDIMAAVRSTGRRTALLAGFETDVCVTHSAAERLLRLDPHPACYACVPRTDPLMPRCACAARQGTGVL